MDEDDVRRRFGARLREIRREGHWSQQDLADRARLHRTYVSQVETGERNLSLVVIVRLAHALGVHASTLLKTVHDDDDQPA